MEQDGDDLGHSSEEFGVDPFSPPDVLALGHWMVSF